MPSPRNSIEKNKFSESTSSVPTKVTNKFSLEFFFFFSNMGHEFSAFPLIDNV